jgi:hypothetical protein
MNFKTARSTLKACFPFIKGKDFLASNSIKDGVSSTDKTKPATKLSQRTLKAVKTFFSKNLAILC